MKKETITQLKKKADKIFSQFIRRKEADKNGINFCFTCGLQRHWKELQCGHFVSRTHSALRYDETNCAPQCFACNIWKRGNIAHFADKLIKKYGKEEFDRLIKEGCAMKQFTIKELQEIILKYENKIKELNQKC